MIKPKSHKMDRTMLSIIFDICRTEKEKLEFYVNRIVIPFELIGCIFGIQMDQLRESSQILYNCENKVV
jgi:hypothetical protein